MGCVNSKKIRSQSPPYDEDVCFTSCGGRRNFRQKSRRLSTTAAPLRRVETASGPLEKLVVDEVKEAQVVVKLIEEREGRESEGLRNDYDFGSEILREELKRGASQKKADVSFPVGRSSESDLAAVGWPAWLCAVAADAIEGWMPLRSDAYERLDKVNVKKILMKYCYIVYL